MESTDGESWSAPKQVSGLGGTPHHIQIVYNPNGFYGSTDSRYKIWYWNKAVSIYNIDTIASAESKDGITWSNDQAITQSDTAKLVTGITGDWNKGSYGPIDVFYQTNASNTGSDPWAHSYVMYFDGTEGGKEFTGLAYSEDGFHWIAYNSNPVLNGSVTAAWDCSDSSYGTVYLDAYGYHFWYSGGGDDDSGGCLNTPTHNGIGYASSPDGKNWTKDPGNPIFYIDDGVSYRDSRVYTPAVINDGSGFLKMYYSAVGTDGIKKIGVAILPYSMSVDIDIMPLRYPNIIRLDPDDECDYNRRLRVGLLTTDEFNALTVDRSTITLGDPSLDGVAAPFRSRVRDVDRDGKKDLLLIFSRCELVTNNALDLNTREMVLKGKTPDGIYIKGSDSVRVIPRR